MISFVFNLKYLRKNLVNFNFQGVFWNPQDVQISKLSLDLNFENAMTCLLPQISQAKLGQFQLSGGVLESSGHTDFKTVPEFEF